MPGRTGIALLRGGPGHVGRRTPKPVSPRELRELRAQCLAFKGAGSLPIYGPYDDLCPRTGQRAPRLGAEQVMPGQKADSTQEDVDGPPTVSGCESRMIGVGAGGLSLCEANVAVPIEKDRGQKRLRRPLLGHAEGQKDPPVSGVEAAGSDCLAVEALDKPGLARSDLRDIRERRQDDQIGGRIGLGSGVDGAQGRLERLRPVLWIHA